MLSILLAFVAIGDCPYQWDRCYYGDLLFASFFLEMTGPDTALQDHQVEQTIFTRFYYAGCFEFFCVDAEAAVGAGACGTPSEPLTDPYQCFTTMNTEHWPIRFYDVDDDGDIDLLDFADIQVLGEDLNAFPE